MQTNKLVVGDTSGDGSLSSADQPPANGQIYAARSIILKPQSSLPAFDAREGELVYNNSDNKLYYYDGSSWVAQGGGGPGSWKCQTVTGAASPDSFANCPSGTQLITGGCAANTVGSLLFNAPYDNSWFCRTSTGNTGAYARCCQ